MYPVHAALLHLSVEFGWNLIQIGDTPVGILHVEDEENG